MFKRGGFTKATSHKQYYNIPSGIRGEHSSEHIYASVDFSKKDSSFGW